MRRRFNSLERRYVFLRHGGTCAICNKKMAMRDKWEVDHITPFSRGGETTLKNAQLLCWKCNREKGNRTVSKRKWTKSLRDWQVRAFIRFQEFYEQNKFSHETKNRSMLINAFPGSGKTTYAMRVIHDWLSRTFDNNKEPFIIWITPKRTLTKQTSEAAGQLGIKLQYDPKMAKWHDGYIKGINGVVITYAITDYHTQFLKDCANRFNLLVVMDECHHVAGLHPVKGISRAWGNAIQEAFSDSAFILMLTGTAWRSDSHQISFARYRTTSDGKLEIVTDFDYTYRDALADTLKAKETHQKIAREITFVTMGGNVEFMYGDEDHQMALTPDLERELTSPALRSALSPAAGNWFRDWFKYADDELVKLRKSKRTPYPDAAGLVIASSVDHMEAYADIIERETGERPLTVSYMEDDPETIIEDFKNNPQRNPRWLLSVQMVSEGVDIPRLSVLMYCTNVRQRLFFFQAVGRVIRYDRNGATSQKARVYIPFVDPLVTYAQEIKDAIQQVIELLDRIGGDGVQARLLLPIENEHAYGDVLRTQDDGRAESYYVELAHRMIANSNSEVPNIAEELAFILKASEDIVTIAPIQDNVEARMQDHPEVWDQKKIEAKRTELDTAIRSMAYTVSGVTHHDPLWRMAKGMINNHLYKLADVSNIEQCGMKEIKIIARELNAWRTQGVDPKFMENYERAARRNYYG